MLVDSTHIHVALGSYGDVDCRRGMVIGFVDCRHDRIGRSGTDDSEADVRGDEVRSVGVVDVAAGVGLGSEQSAREQLVEESVSTH